MIDQNIQALVKTYGRSPTYENFIFLGYFNHGTIIRKGIACKKILL